MSTHRLLFTGSDARTIEGTLSDNMIAQLLAKTSGSGRPLLDESIDAQKKLSGRIVVERNTETGYRLCEEGEGDG